MRNGRERLVQRRSAERVPLLVALKHAGDVVAFTVGMPAADAALRIALAAGAATEGPFDLVLIGTRSFDHGSGEVPALVAEALGLTVVTDVTSLLLGEGIEAERELDGGTRRSSGSSARPSSRSSRTSRGFRPRASPP